MAQAQFHHTPPARDTAALALALSVSVFAERAHLRGQLRDDAEAAGLRAATVGDFSLLQDGQALALGDIVLVDCPDAAGAALAALARLDLRAAHCGAQLVVSTSVAALDDVFACLDQSQPQILVDPSRAERVLALGRALALQPGHAVRELSGDDRLALLRLSEQVGRIAERLDRLSGARDAGETHVESPRPAFAFGGDAAGDRLVRTGQARPPLPESRLVRQIIRQRQARARFFDSELFADPAWDMLLDLTAARAEHAQVSVTSLCIASGVPPTTALRWIGQMTEAGLFRRVDDASDRRRAFIALTDRAADGMARYFAEIGQDAARLI